MTRITIIASGTRGDVQPALLLGQQLAAASHEVTVVAGRNFHNWIMAAGLRAAPASVDIQVVMQSDAGTAWATRGDSPLLQAQLMKRLIDQHGGRIIADAWAACQEAEAILSSFTSDAYALSFAQKTGAFHASMPLQPALVATRYGFALPNAPVPGRATLINYLLSRIMIEPFAWRLYGRTVNTFRQEVLGLPPSSGSENREGRRRLLTLLAYSRHVSPPAPDWPSDFHVTGYWFQETGTDWQPPVALQTFLASGTAPIGFGFGSMAGAEPDRVITLFCDVARRLGRRALILTGWSGANDIALPSFAFATTSAPHDWLLPHLAAFVHHGGAGTTAAALRAAVPMVIVPHMVDQPFWGDRLYRLGVAPHPIPRRSLSVARLEVALANVLANEAMSRKRQALGAKIAAEAGLQRAVNLLTPHLS